VPDDEEFNYDNWCKAVRAGRTFLSGGPIIRFSVDGVQIGDTRQLPRGGTVEVEAIAESIFPIHTLEIVQEDRVVASTLRPSTGAQDAQGESKGARHVRPHLADLHRGERRRRAVVDVRSRRGELHAD
jgi:hypothetical protein